MPDPRRSSNVRCATALAVATIALAACGGGGGGSSGAVPPSPLPTATPSTAPQSSMQGRIVDDAGSPIAGATVRAGTAFQLTPSGSITGILATTTTDANGSFTLSAPPATQIYAQVDKPGYASAHKTIATGSGMTQLQSWTLPAPNSDEAAALSAMNSDRASAGAGAGAQPLLFDADMLEVARYRAQHMASAGFFDHVAPGAQIADASAKWSTLPNTLYVMPAVFSQENIAAAGTGGASTLVAIENDLFAHDTDPQQLHRLNILSKGNVWIGLGAALGGKPYPGSSSSSVNYFAQAFLTTCANACP